MTQQEPERTTRSKSLGELAIEATHRGDQLEHGVTSIMADQMPSYVRTGSRGRGSERFRSEQQPASTSNQPLRQVPTTKPLKG